MPYAKFAECGTYSGGKFMGIKGSLKDMSVADLIQTNCQDRKTARLLLRNGKKESRIFFTEGNIIHANTDGIEGEEAIFSVLEWKEGFFEMELGGKPPKISITSSWSGLLLEGARRIDEKNETNKGKTEKNSEKEAEPMGKLDDILKEMGNEIPGYIASTLAGIDGINLAQNTRTRIDPEAITAQMTMLLRMIDEIFIKLGAGDLEDSLITSEKSYFLMRFLPGKQQYLGIAVDRKTGNLGNIRLISKMYAEKIAKALPH
jgi:predicted regulator of Ras-like GTPase activity (Roadblock/LC7/MglB family)